MYQGGTDRYKNPFGGDGTESAGFAEGVGRGLKMALRVQKEMGK